MQALLKRYNILNDIVSSIYEQGVPNVQTPGEVCFRLHWPHKPAEPSSGCVVLKKQEPLGQGQAPPVG